MKNKFGENYKDLLIRLVNNTYARRLEDMFENNIPATVSLFDPQIISTIQKEQRRIIVPKLRFGAIVPSITLQYVIQEINSRMVAAYSPGNQLNK